MDKDAAKAVYQEHLNSLAAVRKRCASLLPEGASNADLERMRLVLEIVNVLETDATAKLEACSEEGAAE